MILLLAAELLHIVTTKGVKAVAFISHYSTVESDALLGGNLAESGFFSLYFISPVQFCAALL